MRAFVTGGGGFVGSFLCAHLAASGDEVIAPFVDITEPALIAAAIREAAPDAVYHLAGQADVSRSWADPAETFTINVLGTLNVVSAVCQLRMKPRVLIVSSGEVYGLIAPDELPVRETHILRPASPYGASKAAGELAALQAFHGQQVPVIDARPFNHIGPGQSDAFVVSAVARAIAEAEAAGSEEIAVGNLAAARDFSDVRDVVRAYRSCVERGTAGATYNVCSGTAVPISELVDRLIALAERPLRVTVDPERFRPSDVPVIFGDSSRLRADTGWTAVHALDDALAATLHWWRQRVQSS